MHRRMQSLTRFVFSSKNKAVEVAEDALNVSDISILEGDAFIQISLGGSPSQTKPAPLKPIPTKRPALKPLNR